MNAVDTRAIDVMCILIDRLRAQIKRKPSGYRQDQLARAQAELRRRIASQTEMTFDEWLKTDHGRACEKYPITGGSEYLRNRLWWAYQAGLNEGSHPRPTIHTSGADDAAV